MFNEVVLTVRSSRTLVSSMLKRLQTKRGGASSSTNTTHESDFEEDSGGAKVEGKGTLLMKQGWMKWRPFWFELNGEALMQFTKRGSSKPKQVIRLTVAILKSADDLVGEENSFAIFVPGKDAFYFRAHNEEAKAAWLSWLTSLCKMTEWSTSSMVTAFVDPVIVASQDGMIVEINDAALKFFGYERGSMIGKNVRMLMTSATAQHHDAYIRNYLTSGVAKLVGKPRSLVGQHADGSPLPLVLSLGVENGTDGKKTFIATLRPDHVKKMELNTAELDAVLSKAVDTALHEAQEKIKSTLTQEMEGIMKRLEDYKASSKMMAAKGLKDTSKKESFSASTGNNTTEDNSDTETDGIQTPKGKKHELIMIDRSHLFVGQRLGVGGSGCMVYACSVDGWDCAMKELKIANAKQSDIDAFIAEIFLLESLPPHKNLVRFLFHERSSDRIRIFMRRYEGTLERWLEKRKSASEHLSLQDVARFGLDVVRALEILHDYKIIHRDVKSQNLFVNYDMAGNVSHLTLSDFDSAKVVENASSARTIIGTMGWMPPEVYSSGKSYTFSADIWSFGMVVFELMDLGRPFWDVDEYDIATYIGQGNFPKFHNPQHAEQAYGTLLPFWKKCCALNPAERPSLRDIKVELSGHL